jgi:hypothetical protein
VYALQRPVSVQLKEACAWTIAVRVRRKGKEKKRKIERDQLIIVLCVYCIMLAGSGSNCKTACVSRKPYQMFSYEDPSQCSAAKVSHLRIHIGNIVHVWNCMLIQTV